MGRLKKEVSYIQELKASEQFASIKKALIEQNNKTKKQHKIKQAG